ncbi:hypothetical protein JNK13_04330 [bacterium]|nr:hypothetical protein [bacterium]
MNYKLLLIIAFYSIFPSSTRAEIWSCASVDVKELAKAPPILTENPVQTKNVSCKVLDTKQASFQKISADKFSALARPSITEVKNNREMKQTTSLKKNSEQ